MLLMIVVVIVSYHYFKIDLVDAHCHHYWFYHSYDYCDYGWVIEIIIMFVVTYVYIYDNYRYYLCYHHII